MDAVRIKTTPDPMEPFCLSQAFRIGDMVMVSGQAAITKEGELAGVGDFHRQAEQTFANLEEVLEAAGSSLDQVVKVTIYLTDMSHFEDIIALRQKYFSAPYPADTIVEVSSLALPELEIEIEATALVDGKTVNS
ncbi:endoribonuclease L-PSP [Luminiphilus syltensis NOR5-1B]|uniref:Endoribonuclease L-PSP n=1 Tax=Luminiphilus syltensis NOR5-1B TaxID=565045 RepID=B8KTK0_9GAMM|nr:RidA family protein [Luminiphilus syltensis]EED35632.1 endoribonuclease L-PSP [Luminiphilus syltensis NOR5-1B]